VVRERFEHLDQERQDALLKAAADEFSEKGYASASVNRIIARAGMSKGSLYYYFDDKGDLFATVMERATTLMVRLMGGIDLGALTAETFWPSFEELLRRSGERLTRSEWYVKLARAFYRHWGRVGERGEGSGPAGVFFGWVRRWTVRVLERGRELGAVRRDVPLPLLVDLTMALGQVSDRWILEAWDTLSPAERERIIAIDVGLFRRILEPVAEGA
jgi:AcrR family transcriptional regulator